MTVNYTHLASCYCTTSVPGFYQYRPILYAGSCETIMTKLELASRFIQKITIKLRCRCKLELLRSVLSIRISICRRGYENYCKIICFSIYLKYDFYFFFHLSICVWFLNYIAVGKINNLRHNVAEARRYFDISAKLSGHY